MIVCVIFGCLLCIWVIYQAFFRPYTFDELLMLDFVSPTEEEKSLAAFAKRAKSKDDLESLWAYVLRYPRVTGNCSSFAQFHYLLWTAYRLGEESDFRIAVMATEGCLYGVSFWEVMFPAPTFLDK